MILLTLDDMCLMFTGPFFPDSHSYKQSHAMLSEPAMGN